MQPITRKTLIDQLLRVANPFARILLDGWITRSEETKLKAWNSYLAIPLTRENVARLRLQLNAGFEKELAGLQNGESYSVAHGMHLDFLTHFDKCTDGLLPVVDTAPPETVPAPPAPNVALASALKKLHLTSAALKESAPLPTPPKTRPLTKEWAVPQPPKEAKQKVKTVKEKPAPKITAQEKLFQSQVIVPPPNLSPLPRYIPIAVIQGNTTLYNLDSRNKELRDKGFRVVLSLDYQDPLDYTDGQLLHLVFQGKKSLLFTSPCSPDTLRMLIYVLGEVPWKFIRIPSKRKRAKS